MCNTRHTIDHILLYAVLLEAASPGRMPACVTRFITKEHCGFYRGEKPNESKCLNVKNLLTRWQCFAYDTIHIAFEGGRSDSRAQWDCPPCAAVNGIIESQKHILSISINSSSHKTEIVAHQMSTNVVYFSIGGLRWFH